MVGPNKILTVSYGTFSCTLEGFDEPFGTMQAIAEYFRDLAAQDRYFGAEPPTPDAEMLHRIAERAVQRRVESRVQENGIVLRQQSDTVTPALASAPVAVQPGSPPAAAELAKSGVAAAAILAASQPAQSQTDAQPDVQPADVPSEVSDKLARIRAAVARSEAETGAADLLQDTSAPHDTAELEDTLAAIIADDPIDESMISDAFETAEDAGQDFVEDNLSDAADEQPDQIDDEIPAEPVSAADHTDVEFDDFGLFDEDDADAPRDMIEAAAQTDIEDVAPKISAGEAPQDIPEDQFDMDDDRAAEPPADSQEAKTTAAQDFDGDEGFEAERPPALEDTEQREEEDRHSIEILRSEIRALLGRTGLSGSSEAALVNELAQIEQEAVIKHPHFNRKTRKRIPGDTDATAERLLETAKSEMGERESARRRETFEHIKVAVAATRAEEIVEGPRRRDIEQDREIDKYRAGMDTPAPLEPALAKAELLTKAKGPGFAQSTDETWDEMDDEGGSVARSPKAKPQPEPAPQPVMARRPAPVAPKIERPAPAASTPPETTPEDAADVIAPRPRRPAMIGERRTERPRTGRAPLVLVSEQRVDEAAVSNGPIRPRRVHSRQNAASIALEAAKSPLSAETVAAFKTFADDVDAWLLDDQIEAAAAYSTHVLGQEEFLRPDLMRFVLAYNEGKEISREEMLRCFGALLREGRLERGNAGNFRLAPASEYDEPARQFARR